jgi:hypothetical protein
VHDAKVKGALQGKVGHEESVDDGPWRRSRICTIFFRTFVCIYFIAAVNERTQAIYDSIDPPNELRNRIHLRNLALVHVALIISLMQRVGGWTVTNDRQHGARGGMYGAHEHYAQKPAEKRVVPFRLSNTRASECLYLHDTPWFSSK